MRTIRGSSSRDDLELSRRIATIPTASTSAVEGLVVRSAASQRRSRPVGSAYLILCLAF